jgi:nucleotide-binding universal stress UspA family protein
MTILCATDFSDPAKDATSIAAVIADRLREPLLLVHVAHPAIPRGTFPADAIPEGPFDTKWMVGDPDEQILAAAPHDTKLIVVGARGHRRGTHWLIGSVPERLARTAPFPMLVVRNAAPLHAWLTGTKALSVNIATDLTPVSDYALQRASMLKELGPCHVELTYVEYPPADYARLGIEGPIHRRHLHPAVEETITRELQQRVAQANLGGEVQTRIALTIGGIGARIAEIAAEEHADLIVFGAYQRSGLARVWHESTAHAVLHLAETNLFCVPFQDR